jgi:hypothetical protein
VAAAIAQGCATTERASLPLSEQRSTELNVILWDHDAEITIGRSPPASGKAVKIDPTTTRWVERASPRADWQPRQVPTRDLDSVVVRRRALGALEGLGLGLLAGVVVGAAAGYAGGNGHGDYSTPEFQAIVWSGILGVVGGLIGTAIGANLSHKTTIYLCPERKGPQVQSLPDSIERGSFRTQAARSCADVRRDGGN